jgi:hypothetical protein
MTKPTEPLRWTERPHRPESPVRTPQRSARAPEPTVKSQLGLDERAWQTLLMAIREPTRE